MPEPPRIVVKFRTSRLKYEYYQSCQLLGTTMSAHIRRAALSMIRDAKDRFPQAFKHADV